MEHEIHHEDQIVAESSRPQSGNKNTVLLGSVMVSAALLVFGWAIVSSRPGFAGPGGSALATSDLATEQPNADDALAEQVVPAGGAYIPVHWGDLGARMVQSGVIDRDAFIALYAERGGVSEDVKNLLDRADNDRLTITPQNSGQVLNILWALGLANKNRVLDEGPMQSPQYGTGAVSRFASTGGWTLAKGKAMDHYSKHALITLTPEQQKLVERVAQGVYRPCCGNSTYFPDCNHGMAMLGLLELMASQGVSEENMYRAALKVNSYWFPDTYITVAKYLAAKGIAWNDADPKEVLGPQVSSASGYRQILSEVTPRAQRSGGGGCGV